MRYALGSPGAAYATVFAAEGVLFLFSAWLALQVGATRAASAPRVLASPGEGYATGLGRR
jgi:hypothetical protein